jgi:hypothetical protein
MVTNSSELRTKTGRKLEAQALLMHGIGNVLGYWQENDNILLALDNDPERIEEFRAILRREADRLAKLFGYAHAWST